MTTYYVDSAAAQAGTGLSTSTPINTLAAVEALQLNPGDSVLFKDGSSFTGSTPWTGLLDIKAHGTADQPITFGTYGSGAAPTFANTDTNWSASISLTGASHVVINGLAVTNGMQAGVQMDAATNHVTLENMDISHAGTGVILNGDSNALVNNNIHDLKMVVNTPTTVNNNDDYGATGVIISGTNHVLSGNTITNAIAPSYDYGTDGGGFEFWGAASNVQVTGNKVTNAAGFMEMGGQPGNFSNIQVDHNTAQNTGDFADIHNGNGSFGSTISGIVLDHNTIVDTNNAAGSLSTVWLDSPVTKSQFQFSNNIVQLNNGDSVFEQHGDYHFNNVFDLQSSATHLYNNWDMTLNAGESYGAPSFVDAASGNLAIAPGGTGAGLGADGAVILGSTSANVSADSAQAYRLYLAAFDHTPDQAEISLLTNVLDQGTTLHDVAQQFATSPGFQSTYGTNPNADQVVFDLYTNVLGRAPDAAGQAYWVSEVQHGMSYADLLVAFSQSPESIAHNAALTIGFL